MWRRLVLSEVEGVLLALSKAEGSRFVRLRFSESGGLHRSTDTGPDAFGREARQGFSVVGASKKCPTLWVPLFFVFNTLRAKRSAMVSHFFWREW